MSNVSQLNNNFLNVLLKLKNNNTNPFIIFSPIELPKLPRYNDLATKPIDCMHIFCSLCIKKWLKLSEKCPVCRREIASLIKVGLNQN